MIDPIAAIAATGVQEVAAPSKMAQIGNGDRISFDQMLRMGVETTNSKIAEADRMVAAFAVDNDIPAHQVTFALEEARLSLEMMIQVRNRLIEGYQQIMNMQV